jgi:hypothetical protein
MIMKKSNTINAQPNSNPIDMKRNASAYDAKHEALRNSHLRRMDMIEKNSKMTETYAQIKNIVAW